MHLSIFQFCACSQPDDVCFSLNFDTERADAKLRFSSLSLIAKYEAEGRLLVLPVTGHGDMNITLGNNPNKFSGALCC